MDSPPSETGADAAHRGPGSLHPAMARWQARDGQLLVGDWPLERLAARVGSTPFFAYDRAKISERVASLRAALPDRVRLHYAIKANPMPAVVQHLAPLVDGFDIASGQELHVALDTGIDPKRVGFAGPGKTDAELRQAAAAGIIIELESSGEMRRAAAAGEAVGVAPRVAVRVNPDFRLKGAGMHMGGGASQFGVDAERVPDMLREMRELPVDFHGFHIFGGSQNLDAEALALAEQQIAALAISLAEHAPSPVRHLNIGGGFGIPYFPKDRALDLAAVGARLTDIVADLEAALPEAAIIIELGRYIVGEAGVYVTKVIDMKESRGTTYLVTDGGLHHHLAATGNFGQGIRRNYPLAAGMQFGEAPAAEAEIVGCLCTPIDLLGSKVPLPSCEPGDLVVVFQSGAYGASASPQGFLSHPAPLEVLV